jgi:hypothetical protein
MPFKVRTRGDKG